jgi:Kef-type K+ transport system membrane component KefB
VANEDILVTVLIFLAGILALEFRISVAILEVVAGIVAANLFRLTSSNWIDNLSLFGLLGLMFFAGFETDVKLLKRIWRPSLAIGTASFGVPCCLLLGCGVFLLDLKWQEALLLAISLSTTSVALLYTLFKERHLVTLRAQHLLMSAAMVVDIISIFALAIIFEGMTALSVLVFAFSLLFLSQIPKLGTWLIRRYHSDQIEFRTRFVLLVLLSMVLLSKQASIHVSLFGFFIGIFFSEFMEADQELASKLKSMIFGLMAPIFFFKAGLYVRLASFQWSLLPLMLFLGMVAFWGKYLGTFLTARRYLSAPEARLAGLLFNVQLTFSIIAATFGLESGILRQELFQSVILIVVGASILTSILIRHSPAAEVSPMDHPLQDWSEPAP